MHPIVYVLKSFESSLQYQRNRDDSFVIKTDNFVVGMAMESLREALVLDDEIMVKIPLSDGGKMHHYIGKVDYKVTNADEPETQSVSSSVYFYIVRTVNPTSTDHTRDLLEIFDARLDRYFCIDFTIKGEVESRKLSYNLTHSTKYDMLKQLYDFLSKEEQE